MCSRFFRFAGITLACMLLLPSTLMAAQATFSWRASTDTSLAGYKIHYGTSPGHYTQMADVGKPAPTNGRIYSTITGLQDGTTYYFAATAYDRSGRRSSYSNEISYTVPLRSWGADEKVQIMGATPDATVPLSIRETFINIDNHAYEGSTEITTWSWSRQPPHHPINAILLKVDLSSLPHTAIIDEAILSLYQTEAYGAASYRNSVHKIIGVNPVIASVTGQYARRGIPWAAVPPGTTDNNIPIGLANIANPESSIVLGTQNGYRSWHITRMVQDWVRTPNNNFGLLIYGDSDMQEETGRTFAASENSNPAIRPKIVIHYRLAAEAGSTSQAEQLILGADDRVWPRPPAPSK